MSGIRIGIDDSKFRTVVLWSGGLDSTIVLHQAALATYSKSDPVIALSIRSHLGGPKNRFNGQTKARENYLRFAKRIGLNIEGQEIDVNGSAQLEADGVVGGGMATLREFQVFWPWILPFLRSGDILLSGYVGDTSINCEHIKSLIMSYGDLAKWDDVPILRFPLELFSKDPGMLIYEEAFVRMCLSYNIPRNCVYSCATGDSDSNNSKCYCLKCQRVRDCTITDKSKIFRKTPF